MPTVASLPKLVGEKFTLDVQVGEKNIRGSQNNKSNSYKVLLPSGNEITSHNTVSLLAGSTPGVHWPISRYYIRRVRLMKNSQLIEPLKKAGLHIEPAVGSESTTVVVEFPISIGDKIRTQDEVSIWEKTFLASFVQQHWADNQVSVTIDFDPATESNDIAPILDYFQYKLKSVSFLPRGDAIYPQMPYEPITKDQYEERVKGLSKLSFDKEIFSKDSEKEMDVFCDGETCTIGKNK